MTKIATFLAELLKSKKQTALTEWVFPHFQHPEQPISPASAYRKLKVILKNAELPLIRLHDLRHTFATHPRRAVWIPRPWRAYSVIPMPASL